MAWKTPLSKTRAQETGADGQQPRARAKASAPARFTRYALAMTVLAGTHAGALPVNAEPDTLWSEPAVEAFAALPLDVVQDLTQELPLAAEAVASEEVHHEDAGIPSASVAAAQESVAEAIHALANTPVPAPAGSADAPSAPRSIAAAPVTTIPVFAAPAAPASASTLIAVQSANPVTSASASASSNGKLSESQLASLESALIERVNADRVANGLAPVAPDPDLLKIARTRASAQIPLPSLSHNDATGQLAISRLLNGDRIQYQLAGENLARLAHTGDTTAANAETALMKSPTHRKNILEPKFNKLAIGAAMDDTGRVIFAQIFRQA